MITTTRTQAATCFLDGLGWAFCLLLLLTAACNDDDGGVESQSDASIDTTVQDTSGQGRGELRWYFTCGDPEPCPGHTPSTAAVACSADEQEGASCGPSGAFCDPADACNRLLLCTDSDPTLEPLGCEQPDAGSEP
ncbi:MAG: hypothetical protein AAFS10_22170 [Myxococcota bacterium]